MRCAIAITLLFGACSNLGPFRAGGEEDGMRDAGMTTDGRTGDGMIVIDADQTVMPKKLVDVSGSPEQLAVTNGYVYWTQLDDYKIGRVAKSGGSAQTMVPGGIPLSFEARDGDVYWVSNRELHKTSDGDFTASAALHTNTGLMSALALSATDIYFFHDTAGVGDEELHKLSRAGGSPQVQRSGLNYPGDLAIDGTTLYLTHGAVIEKAALSALASPTEVEMVIGPRLASGGGRLCWAFTPNSSTYTEELWCSSSTGGKNKIASAPMAFFSFVMSSSHVYFIPRYNDGSTEIFAYSFATGQTSFIATPPIGTLAIALAVDTTALYWLTSDNTNGEIWKLPL